MKDYQKDIKELEEQFHTSLTQGLSMQEAKEREATYGKNELKGKKKTPLIVKFLLQFRDILVIILLIAAIISIIVEPEDWIDSLIIFLVVMVNAIIGVVQESRAEASLEALKKMSTPTAKVKRDGVYQTLPSSDVMPGDILSLEAGDYVPADARIIESASLKVDESALTGESLPVEKEAKILTEEVPLGDQVNTVFSSTYVTYGRAEVLVTSTGMQTQIGQIAKMIDSEENKKTPLQHKLNQIGKVMGILSLIICVVVFIFQLFIVEGDHRFLEAFKISIALAVAAIPEGLATVVTIMLSMGVKKMARKNAIVKKLTAVETLGCTSVVCSDKTGTLTQNKMTVVEVYDGKKEPLEEGLQSRLLSYFALCCDAKMKMVNGEEVCVGDPTEVALLSAQEKYGELDIEQCPRLEELPFDSERKRMSVVVSIDGKKMVITKGAPDGLFSICDGNLEDAKEQNAEMASRALRVLALGIKEWKEGEELESHLQFVGLVGMIDPEREEVKPSIALAKKAGIHTVMITGDHVVTARAIAKNLGIFEEDSLAITSEELQAMSDEELDEKIEKIVVYARVAPSDKVRIVKAWQKKGKVVSMTGDGVNDAPALKAADIGCAMGITGTDVSKEAAAMILTDDNFSTIISAVEEGRNIYANIKKSVKYLLSSNIGEVVTIFLSSVIALISGIHFGSPLLPIHLLWINLITDSLPAFSLGMEESGREQMEDAPRDKNESFFAHHLGLHIALEGLFIGLLTLGSFFVGYSMSGIEVGQTMAFVTLSFLELFHSFNVRSDRTIFSKGTFRNRWLIGSFFLGTALTFGVLYIPFISSIFKLATLSGEQLGIALAFAISIILVMEVYKLVHKLWKKKSTK